MATAEKRVPGTPFVKGQSGNPGGRPKGTSITSVLRALMTDDDKAEIARQLIRGARAGEMDKIREVLDRTEGKSVGRTETGGPGDFVLDLTQDERDRLRAALKVVRGRRGA